MLMRELLGIYRSVDMMEWSQQSNLSTDRFNIL